jgi:hypothetical protein
MFAKLLLWADALSLGAFGTFGLTMDLLSYFAGIGAWQNQFLNNPLAVGVVEAHGLAIIVSVLLFRYASALDRRTGHGLGIMAHILMGTANLIFWQLFLTTNQLALGYITTSYHWIFVTMHLFALTIPSRQTASD